MTSVEERYFQASAKAMAPARVAELRSLFERHADVWYGACQCALCRQFDDLRRRLVRLLAARMERTWLPPSS